MFFSVKLRCVFVCLLVLDAKASAEEINFGKQIPSSQAIIEALKSPNDSEAFMSEHPHGLSRGLKMINSNSIAPMQKNIGSTSKQNAVSLQVLFAYNSAILTEDAKEQLRPLGEALASPVLQGVPFRIEGHTDVVGGDQFNIDLSMQRAAVVRNYLITQYQLDESLIDIIGLGKKGLANKKNPTSEENRRVSIVRLAK